VETTGSEYFQKPIFSFFDNYEYSGLAFKFERAPMCPSRAAKRLLQKFTLHIELSSEVFLSFTKTQQNKHELGAIFISCNHICDQVDWTKFLTNALNRDKNGCENSLSS
jgi:hypothetical protein